jgi:hypothetical protein
MQSKTKSFYLYKTNAMQMQTFLIVRLIYLYHRRLSIDASINHR